MMSFVTELFTAPGFEPHGHCFLWSPRLLWLYVLSDGLIAFAYYSIPVGLLLFVRHRRDLAFKPIFLMFGAFIVACGTTHLLGVWTLWHPDYWLDGSLKALTAVLSLGTAAAVWRVLPEALALPSPAQLAEVNRALRREIEERRQLQVTLEARTRALLEAQDARSLFEGVPVGLYRSTPEGRLLDVNPALVRILGYPSRESLLATDVVQLHELPADRQRWRAELERAGVVQGFEVAWRRYDGRVIWVRTFDRVICDARGEPQYYEGVIEDITERRRADEEIRKLYQVMAQSPLSVVVTDAAGTIEYANSAFTEITGYTAVEVLGANPRLLKSGHQEPAFYRQMWDTLLSGETWRGEVVNRRKDGTLYTQELLIAPVRDAGDRPSRFVGLGHDVTEAKRLRESLDMAQVAMDHSTDLVIWVNAEGCFTYTNESARRRLGYTRDELLALRLWDVAGSVQRDSWPARWEATRQAGSVALEDQVRCADGSTFPVEVVVTHVRLGAKEVQCAILRDLTERKEGARRLADAHAFNASVLAAAPVGIVTYRQTGECVSCNETAAAIVGGTVEALKRQNFRTLESWKTSGLFDLGERAISTREPQEADVRVITTFGKEVWLSARAAVFRSGNEDLLLLIIADTTARKRLEDELRQAQKMEAVGRLAGGVAHDFNNLLTVIQGRSALLQAHLAAGDPLRRHVDLIEQAGSRAAALTRQLLAFSRKQVIDPKVLDLNALVAGLEPMLRRLLGEDIELVTASTPPVDRVMADPGQLEQVIMNLVVNARDAMPRGGALRIETMTAELDAQYAKLHPGTLPGRYVMLAVSDTGIGMDAATKARIFEPFFTTKGEQGTGLGLATVYGIVKEAGGTVRVYSEPGLGATFKVFLPGVAEAAARPAAGPDAAPPPGGTETLLLVEDEESLRHLTQEILAGQGYTVLEARHGGEALLVAGQHAQPIHLVLTDVIMPGLSGRQLAERLTQMRPGLRVLYMSGYTAGAIEQHGVLEPGMDFLPKPFTPAQLLHTVREVLDRGA